MDQLPALENHAPRVIEEKLRQKVVAATSNLRPQSMSQDDAARVARGFETLFIHELYKTMRKAMLESPEDREEDLSFGADTLDTLSGIGLAEQLAHSGHGIGIAQLVYQHLTGYQLPMITEIALQHLNSSTRHTPTPSLSNKPADPPSLPHSSMLERIKERLAPLQTTIEQAAAQHGLPTWLIKAVIAAESAGIPTAVSSAGAKGLMQLMDSTASEMGVRDAFDPVENILGGTRYLRLMLDRFGSVPLALAAYNAGPGTVARHGGIPPYPETRTYVHRVEQYAAFFRDNA